MGLRAGEARRALARALIALRVLVRIGVVAALIAVPYTNFVGDGWTSPSQQDLVAADRPAATPAPTAATAPAARAAPVARGDEATPAPAAPTAAGGWVWASWYGPGFYGHRTACGLTLEPGTWGVANRTLPCGTAVSVSYHGRTVSAPVIDRGPYVAGRSYDLSAAVANALGFTGVQLVYVAVP